ncbi:MULTISPECIES: gas vesicle protein GvpG [Streptomyces]|uniref:Gas vesicle synthesis protein n=1 Tax=Streptomyces cadmiisoli TaxID=2184053 RepID=A0A2Z4J3N2_9ACTN|nr:MULTISPECIES: gas vesicle protein GvpG [Streptomyces]AWW39597.1 gas vesicle synthesis protein [Streptomyces cadmiisoli]
MGLVFEVIALPLAPVRGVGWVLDKLIEAAEQEAYDPAPVRAALSDLERARNEGRVDEEQFALREQELLERLEEIRVYQLGRARSGRL